MFVNLVDLAWFIFCVISLSVSLPCYWSDDKSARKYCNHNCSSGNLAWTTKQLNNIYIYIQDLLFTKVVQDPWECDKTMGKFTVNTNQVVSDQAILQPIWEYWISISYLEIRKLENRRENKDLFLMTVGILKLLSVDGKNRFQKNLFLINILINVLASQSSFLILKNERS